MLGAHSLFCNMIFFSGLGFLWQVRKELDRLLKSKIEKPDLPFGESSHFIEAVISLLSNPH